MLKPKFKLFHFKIKYLFSKFSSPSKESNFKFLLSVKVVVAFRNKCFSELNSLVGNSLEFFRQMYKTNFHFQSKFLKFRVKIKDKKTFAIQKVFQDFRWNNWLFVDIAIIKMSYNSATARKKTTKAPFTLIKANLI